MSRGGSVAIAVLLGSLAVAGLVFAAGAAREGSGLAWVGLATGLVGGAAAGFVVAGRRWNEPARKGTARGGLGAGVVGAGLAGTIDGLPPAVRAACWAFSAAVLVAGIVEIVHRRRLAPADATS
jgi:nitrate/nitrite transporter NarK